MPLNRNKIYTDFYRAMDAMDDTISMLTALNSMLEYTLRSGENLKETGYGTYRLFQQQCDDLRFLRDAITDQYRALKQGKLEIKNPEHIAEWAGVSQHVVNRVISIATGINLGPPTENHTDEPPYVLKKKSDDLQFHAFNEEFGHQVAPENMGG